MQEVYQINVIPAYKPWRGFSSHYTTDKEVFDLFQEQSIDNMSVSGIPDHLKYLAVEPVYNQETGSYESYVPNGSEDWDSQTATVDGEEICLDMSIYVFLDNSSSLVTFPFILLGTTEAYTD